MNKILSIIDFKNKYEDEINREEYTDQFYKDFTELTILYLNEYNHCRYNDYCDIELSITTYILANKDHQKIDMVYNIYHAISKYDRSMENNFHITFDRAWLLLRDDFIKEEYRKCNFPNEEISKYNSLYDLISDINNILKQYATSKEVKEFVEELQ